MNLSVAIPFYNTSEHFLETVRTPLSCDLVSEILVSDDCSSQEEYNNLLQIINSLNSNKIKVIKNDSNKGAFINKYIAVKNCTNDWVYLLDSDNFVHENMIELFLKENLNDNTCYMPNKYNFCSYIYELDLGFNTLTKEDIKQAITNGTIGHFVNLGNFFVNKNKYVERMKAGLEGNMDTIADCATMTYLWLKNGGEFKILKDFRYFHRVRDNGYFLTNKESAMSCVEYYYNLTHQL